MPLVPANDPAAIEGKVHSHRFPGANTALPYVNRDEEQFRVVEQFLKDGQVSVDIFALSEALPLEVKEVRPSVGREPELASTFAVGEEAMSFGAAQAFIRKPTEVIAPIDKVDATVRRGDVVRIDLVVRTRKVGHFFPGGTVDAFDVWLELQAVDDRGQIIFWSGMVEDEGKGPVEKGAHFYRSLLVDEHGNPINKRNAWAARSVVYVRLIPPGAADTAHFRLKIPENCGDTIYLKAKLNYRKFAWWNTQWAFAGVRDPLHKDFALGPGFDDGRWLFAGDTSDVSGQIKAIPDLPIIVMAEDEAMLKVVAKSEERRAKSEEQRAKSKEQRAKSQQETESPTLRSTPYALSSKPYALSSSDRERWNDYGIGLLLQGDLKGAEQAFLKVTEIDPQYADGWVNIGRARVQEGDTVGAQEVLKKALALDPELAKTHFFYAMTLKTQGRYDEALDHLRKAASKYPRDRVVRNQIGRILFLKRQYTAAIAEFTKTLEVDPEDLQAHYNLMLCYQGLGNKEMTEKERKLYLRFKADESSQFITGPYRRLHLEDNNERQPIHEHVSVALEQVAKHATSYNKSQ